MMNSSQGRLIARRGRTMSPGLKFLGPYFSLYVRSYIKCYIEINATTSQADKNNSVIKFYTLDRVDSGSSPTKPFYFIFIFLYRASFFVGPICLILITFLAKLIPFT